MKRLYFDFTHKLILADKLIKNHNQLFDENKISLRHIQIKEVYLKQRTHILLKNIDNNFDLVCQIIK